MNHAAEPAIPHQCQHVLLIDDDVFMLEMISIMLADLGVARVTMAGDGRQGLSAFEVAGPEPDLIICDINMPNMDGFQLMELLGAKHPGCGIILMSGLAKRFIDSALLMAKFHHLNILGALRKPVDKRELAALMARDCLPESLN